ncbi:hypothetical protein FIBSPDRAFT_767581 [Athelia psychrophila]|uniref:HTH psq-type domain-containing protein n=1 Tax=Athelia psychrophila TaxID=1759441 RepID=A0A167UUI5_9AGAM|nr:hypothetical protein FIBSPDRAFT_767581 [Fibularhizoctonia sp. CBS 109695]
MVFRHISKDIKDRALYLLSEGYITEDVCDIFDVSERSLCRWRANLEAHATSAADPRATPNSQC